jgi:hypothetical protein
LFLGESVLSELAHELLNLDWLAAVEVREALEDLSDFLLIHSMVKPEDKLDLLYLFLKVVLADKLRAFKKCLHDLLL